MKKGLLLSLVTALLLLMLQSCWDYMEYENMSLISLMGIDYNEESKEVTVTVQYLLPGKHSDSGGGGGKPKAASNTGVKSSSGLTVTDALARIQQFVGKRLFYGYVEAEIIGEDAARNIMDDIIGFNDRTPEIRTTTYLAATAGKAADALYTVDPDITMSSGRHIRDQIVSSLDNGSSFPVSEEDFAERMLQMGIEPVTPRISTTPAGGRDGKGAAGSTADGGQESGSSDQKVGYHSIDGIAVFKKSQLAGWLEGHEATGFGWIKGANIKPFKSVQISGKGETNDTLILQVTNSKSRIKVRLDGGRPVVNVSVYAEANLKKYAKTMKPIMMTPDVVNNMQKMLEDSIRSDIESTVKKCQKEFESDVFGFGASFYRQHPKVWHSEYEQKWEEIFPNVLVTIDVNVKMIHTGTNFIKFLTR